MNKTKLTNHQLKEKKAMLNELWHATHAIWPCEFNGKHENYENMTKVNKKIAKMLHELDRPQEDEVKLVELKEKTWQERDAAISVLKQISKFLARDYVGRKCICKVCTDLSSEEIQEPCLSDHEWYLKDKSLDEAIKLIEEYYF